MDPEDDDARKMRPRAAHVVQSLPDFSEFSSKHWPGAIRSSDRSALPRSVGWLSREKEAGNIRARFVPPGKADLWVVVPKEDKRGRWKKIGTIAGGKTQIRRGKCFNGRGPASFRHDTPD